MGCLCLTYFSFFSFSAYASTPDPKELIFEMKEGYKNLKDYRATFIKQEKIGNKLREEESIFFIFKRPFKVRMKWLTGGNKGREALYVEGENNNKLIVKMTGLIGAFLKLVTLDPEGAFAKGKSGRSIKQAGIGNMAASLITFTRNALNLGHATLKLLEEEKVDGREVYVVERILPADKYDTPKTYIYIDKELKVPLQVERYGKEGELIERYAYHDLKINQDISDTEFKFRKKFGRKKAEKKRIIQKARKVIKRAEKEYARINDYTALFEKREIVEGEVKESVYEIKFLKPFYLYLKEIEGKYKDTEIYFSPVLNDGRLYVKPGGVVGTVLKTLQIKGVPLDVDAKVVKKDNRHPISEFGIGSFLEKYSKDFERGIRRRELFIEIQDKNLEGEKGDQIELILKNKKNLPDYYAYRTLAFFTKPSYLPSEIKVFNEDGELLEYYRYSDIEVNTGLELEDFLPDTDREPNS